MADWRYITQNILTGEFINWGLPLVIDSGPTWELSGPGSLSGSIHTSDANRTGALEEWQTAVYAEADGQIRWGGILRNREIEGPLLKVDFAGFSSYAAGIPYVGARYQKTNWDPTQAFTDIWSHVQAMPDGALGVTVSRPTPCPIRVGTVDEPYLLAPEEAPDCGGELDQLATETPFDYTESHTWGAGQTIVHKITVSYPRLGQKRPELVFRMNANVTSIVPVKRDGEGFANTVYGIGKGEGASTVRAEVAVRDGRLRRPYVYTDKTADTAARLRAKAGKQFAFRQLTPDVESIVVKNHPNARIGSWNVGDDIRVQATLPWQGELDVWCRVIGWTLIGENAASIQLARSDSFSYGAG